MSPASLETIVHICLSMEKKACTAYTRFAADLQDTTLCDFWHEMAREEGAHVAFWARLMAVAQSGSLAGVVDDAERTATELRKAEKQADALCERWEKSNGTGEALLLAYRLEFYMLHPVFARLFRTMGALSDELNPADSYEAHIDRFVDMLASHADTSMELELLGETLRTLWRANKDLAEQATTDPLTGLLNRRAFFDFANHVTSLAQRNHQGLGVLMMDIDDFKKLNDTHGHQAGDDVLRTVAGMLHGSLRRSDLVGRYGGEEFIAVLLGSEEKALRETAEKVRKAVERSDPRGLPVTVSVGAAHGKPDSLSAGTLQQLIGSADSALYSAKRSGKNKVVLAEAEV